MDSVETGVLLSDFAQQLRRKTSGVPDNYFTILDAAGISPSLFLHQNFEAKDTGSWPSFEK